MMTLLSTTVRSVKLKTNQQKDKTDK
jgi:hypothetical protein